jgi:hypothetical protein
MKADPVAVLVKSTRARLKAWADPKFEAAARWFFKEPVKPYGVRTPQVRELARLAYGDVKLWPVRERDRFVTELWKSGMLEEGVLVSHLYRRFAKSCDEREFRMFEQWLDRYVGNWSHCDGFHLVDCRFDRESSGFGGSAGSLDEIEESMEASIGSGVLDPGSQARQQHRNNLPHLWFIAERCRRYGAKGRGMAAEGNLSEEAARSFGFSGCLEESRAAAGAASCCRKDDGQRPPVAFKA